MLVPLKLPPGISRPGTKYDARGRWYDSNLVRWPDGAMQAVGGWQMMRDSTDAALSTKNFVRGMIAWRDNLSTSHLLIGTPDSLEHYAAGSITDISPADLTPGNRDTVSDVGAYAGGGVGGAYGVGVYGTGDLAAAGLIEATTWQMDSYGEDAVAVHSVDGRILYWDRSAGGLAAPLAGAPTGVRGVMVTAERFIVALGMNGDARMVGWCDQEDATDWNFTDVTNQAGFFPLPGAGQLMAGRAGRGETLIWTDVDLFSMRFIGGPLVYSFQQAGAACGPISRRAMTVVDGRAFWMGTHSFFRYDGFVQPLPSEVADFVFGSMNRVQAAKIWVDVRAAFNEVTWYYPSAGSAECDRYVTYNYAAGYWSLGQLSRTAGVDQGAFPYPVMTDAEGTIYQHEVGDVYTDRDGTTLTPFAESGPLEVGEGDRVTYVSGVVPDEKTLGDMSFSLIGAMYPTSAETEYPVPTMRTPSPMRCTARQFRVRVEQVNPGWRLGTPRLDITLGGRR